MSALNFPVEVFESSRLSKLENVGMMLIRACDAEYTSHNPPIKQVYMGMLKEHLA